jgi:hypothetical protein
MTQLAPLDWLDADLGGYSIIQDASGTVLPQENILQIVGYESLVDDPSNLRSVLTLPTASTAPTDRVAVSSSGTSSVYTRELVDLSGGSAITRTLPTGAPSGARVSYKIVAGPVNSTAKLIVAAPAGGTIEKLPETTGGVGMVMGASTTFELVGDLGASVTWEADGANNWEIV